MLVSIRFRRWFSRILTIAAGFQLLFGLAEVRASVSLDTSFGTGGALSFQTQAIDDLTFIAAFPLDATGVVLVSKDSAKEESMAIRIDRIGLNGTLTSLGHFPAEFVYAHRLLGVSRTGELVAAKIRLPSGGLTFSCEFYSLSGEHLSSSVPVSNLWTGKIKLSKDDSFIVEDLLSNTLMRFNSDCSRDMGFARGAGAIAVSQSSQWHVHPSGRVSVYVAGNNGEFDFTQYDATGTIDSSRSFSGVRLDPALGQFGFGGMLSETRMRFYEPLRNYSSCWRIFEVDLINGFALTSISTCDIGANDAGSARFEGVNGDWVSIRDLRSAFSTQTGRYLDHLSGVRLGMGQWQTIQIRETFTAYGYYNYDGLTDMVAPLAAVDANTPPDLLLFSELHTERGKKIRVRRLAGDLTLANGFGVNGVLDIGTVGRPINASMQDFALLPNGGIQTLSYGPAILAGFGAQGEVNRQFGDDGITYLQFGAPFFAGMSRFASNPTGASIASFNRFRDSSAGAFATPIIAIPAFTDAVGLQRPQSALGGAMESGTWQGQIPSMSVAVNRLGQTLIAVPHPTLIHPDVVAGRYSQLNISLSLYSPSGDPVGTLEIKDLLGQNWTARSNANQALKVIAVPEGGWYVAYALCDLYLFKLTPNLTIDPSVGSNGRLTVPFDTEPGCATYRPGDGAVNAFAVDGDTLGVVVSNYSQKLLYVNVRSGRTIQSLDLNELGLDQNAFEFGAKLSLFAAGPRYFRAPTPQGYILMHGLTHVQWTGKSIEGSSFSPMFGGEGSSFGNPFKLMVDESRNYLYLGLTSDLVTLGLQSSYIVSSPSMSVKSAILRFRYDLTAGDRVFAVPTLGVVERLLLAMLVCLAAWRQLRRVP